MITITQNGYNFVYRAPVPGQSPRVEEWGIERVGAFVFLVEFYRINSQKYVGKYTLVAAVGSIQYELDGFDKDTNRDIDKLTRLLMPYTTPELKIMWYTQFNKALDMAERMLKEKVADLEAPYEVAGNIFTPKPFYQRMSKADYDEKVKADMEAARTAVGATIDDVLMRIWFHDYGTLLCKVTKETNSYIWVDGFAGGEQVVSNTRIRKDSSKIIQRYEVAST